MSFMIKKINFKLLKCNCVQGEEAFRSLLVEQLVFFFDEGIKKSFWQSFKESLLLEPNFNGIGIDLKKLFSSR